VSPILLYCCGVLCEKAVLEMDKAHLVVCREGDSVLLDEIL
jgi:hypothetical protein